MPRNVLLTCDRYLTDKVTPGNRIKIVGILSITKQAKDNTGGNKGV
jgi:DNA replication licensing factor MCM5